MNATLLKQLNLLKPGDIILQEGGDPFSQHVKRLSQGNYSHVRIYTGKNKLGNHGTIEILTSGVIEQELFTGFQKLKAIKFSAFRHKELNKFPHKVNSLLEIARNYKEKSFYASMNYIELTSKILTYDYFARKTPNPELLRKIYEKYFYILLRARKDNIKLFTCSGFVYQVFFDADFPIYNNRFDVAPNYRDDEDYEIKSFLNQLKNIAKNSTDEDSFLKELISNNILENEISDEEFLDLLYDECDTLFELLNELEEKDREFSNRNLKKNLTKIERKTKKKIKKTIEAYNLLYMIFADSLYRPLYNRKLNNDNLVPANPILNIYRNSNTLFNIELPDYIFFGVSDIATSSSLEPILENITLS